MSCRLPEGLCPVIQNRHFDDSGFRRVNVHVLNLTAQKHFYQRIQFIYHARSYLYTGNVRFVKETCMHVH